ncbi:MAG: ATP-binding cassette domain-containing protein [wastewater metagenome]|nr:ATP-binding cassette domain-containing protein [Candidatus Loosdrechtia aerotolerans]
MIEVQGLCMHYGPTVALDNVSFTVKKGEIFGLLGPNGAGKTTTMRILATHIMPVKGSAKIGDFNVLEDPKKVRSILGYLPENAPLYPEMEVAEYLNFVLQARNLTGNTKKKRLDWVLIHCGLKNVYHRPIGDLSKGYRQRVGLAQALIHDPQVLILDEPTSGLDPVQIMSIRELIKELAKEKTIILSTHILQEAAAISDKLLIIDRGRIVGKGSVDEIAQSLQPCTTTRFAVRTPASEVKNSLSKIPKIVKTEILNEKEGITDILVETSTKDSIWEDLSSLARMNGWDIKEIREHSFSLEDIFLSLVDKERVEK